MNRAHVYRAGSWIRNATWAVALVLAAYFLIHLNAMEIIVPIYRHFMPRDITFWEHVIAIGFALIPLLFLPLDRTTPASCASWTLYGFVYLGAAIIGIKVLPSFDDYFALMAFLCACLALFHVTASQVIVPKPTEFVSQTRMEYLLFLVLGALTIYIWFKADFTLKLGIDDVYERRLAAREAGGFAGYALGPFRLLLPILAIYAWKANRRVLWMGLLALACLGIYSYDGTKSTFLYPILLLVLMYGISRGQLALTILLIIVGINVLAYVEHVLLGSDLLADYIIRRSFVGGGMLTAFYWEYAPQAQDISQITFEIGSQYFNSPEDNANSNFWMWGWAWMGVAGSLMVSVLAGALVATFKVAPGSRYPFLGCLMACGCALIWSEQFLHTSMLSSGIVFVIGLAWIMRITPFGFRSLHPRKSISGLHPAGGSRAILTND